MALLLFGGSTVAAVLDEDRSFFSATSARFAAGLIPVGVPWLKLRFVWIERVLDGTPIVVSRDGEWSERDMRRLRLQQAEVRPHRPPGSRAWTTWARSPSPSSNGMEDFPFWRLDKS